jgi:Xaa-Pro dipeptidase
MDDCIAEELEVKLARVRAYMRERGLDALILRRFDNFAWITAGGDNRCAGATDVGVASVLVTPDDQWVLTSSVEGRRFQEEVLAHIWAGGVFQMGEYPWHREAAALRETADCVVQENLERSWEEVRARHERLS